MKKSRKNMALEGKAQGSCLKKWEAVANKQKSSGLAHLAEKWPSSLVARRLVSDFTGGLMSEKYLANLDSLGLGPSRVKVGRLVAYRVIDLIAWLEGRMEPISEDR
ncbi:MAG TPA: hypothetical protein DEQ20_00950 [Desulfobulbaceae bacterium]|nr:MAG: hypothetical protein A2520_06170 [Deltaproteobacteria bacterium RIFOXYD12_FULL_53_23]HCC53485.1 hypothetical protein [Desulfobulbaceae bacterium]